VLPSDIAGELAAYDASEPVLASAALTDSGAESGVGGAEVYLSFLEQDVSKEEAHH
jgi:F-type H+-transporting ATPase subunit h